MARSLFISPRLYVPNTSASWTMARKASGIPYLEYVKGTGAGGAADGNVILDIPIPALVDSAGGENAPRLPDTIDLYHFVSAVSAGVKAISAGSTGIHLYEVDWTTPGKIYTGGAAVNASAALAGEANTRASAGFIAAQQVSAVACSPSVLPSAGSGGIVGLDVSALPTSAVALTITLGLAPPYPNQESDKTHPYYPRLTATSYVLEISAAVGASAVWEHFGALCKWN